jgi:Ca2+-binding RTX toxin-like protein
LHTYHAIIAAVVALTVAVPAPARDEPGGDYAGRLCAQAAPGTDTCGPGNGRRSAGGAGTGKVSHVGWPAIDGVFWQVLADGRAKRSFRGADRRDELLGHHGNDTIFGGPGSDVLWGDWDPRRNTRRQRDTLSGGGGDDFLYSSHGRNVLRGGPGRDFLFAYYGHGTLDCGPGHDSAKVRMNGAYRLRGCETVLHFCAFGSDGHGGCRKPSRAARANRIASTQGHPQARRTVPAG